MARFFERIGLNNLMNRNMAQPQMQTFSGYQQTMPQAQTYSYPGYATQQTAAYPGYTQQAGYAGYGNQAAYGGGYTGGYGGYTGGYTGNYSGYPSYGGYAAQGFGQRFF